MAKKKKTATRPGRKPRARDVLADEGVRERIMHVATKLFAEKGLDGVTVREIARATKANLSLVSYYFGGKEGLYRAILEEHAQRKGARLLEAIKRSHRGEATKAAFQGDIRSIVGHMVEMRMGDQDISILMQRERLSGLPYSRKIYEEIMAPLAEDILGVIVDAQKKGVVQADLNARSYFISLIESIFGYFAFHDCGLKIWKDAYRFPKDKEQYIEFMVRLYTEGIFA